MQQENNQQAASPSSDPSTTPPEAPMPGRDDCNLAMLAHLLAILGFIAPLVIWIIKKDESAYIEQHARESLNFQITLTIIYIALMPISIITCGFGSLLYFPVFIVHLVFCILASMAANQGQPYTYPICLRLVK